MSIALSLYLKWNYLLFQMNSEFMEEFTIIRLPMNTCDYRNFTKNHIVIGHFDAKKIWINPLSRSQSLLPDMDK